MIDAGNPGHTLEDEHLDSNEDEYDSDYVYESEDELYESEDNNDSDVEDPDNNSSLQTSSIKQAGKYQGYLLPKGSPMANYLDKTLIANMFITVNGGCA